MVEAPPPGSLPTVAFGTSPEQQDALADLVARGIKRATTSVLAAYAHEGEPLPAPGELADVVDGSGRQVCIIRTTSVEIRRYAAVDADHAFAEGEGDRTLPSWRADHDPFLREVCEMLGIAFSDDLELVLERFELTVPPESRGPATRAAAST